MPYIKEICRAGKTIEVVKKFSPRFGKKIPRTAGKFNETTDEQKKVNERAAAIKLRRLINHNFSPGDFHLILTYSQEKKPKTAAAARKDLENFLRRLRSTYKKQGEELKYITVTEYKNRNIHHHLVINCTRTKDITNAWKSGRIKVNPLDDSGQYRALAEYLIKETQKTFKTPTSAYGKRWNQSRNLKKPEVIKKIIKASSWAKNPRPEKGYRIEEVYNGYSDKFGYPYQCCTMVRIE